MINYSFPSSQLTESQRDSNNARSAGEFDQIYESMMMMMMMMMMMIMIMMMMNHNNMINNDTIIV